MNHYSKNTNKIYLRPGLRIKKFLQSLHSYYKLIVVNSENKDYTEQIIKFIVIEQKTFIIDYINKILFILMKKL